MKKRERHLRDGLVLNPKQALFVRHYLILNNGTQAAIAAGYSRKAARQAGSALLTNPAIDREIQQARAEQNQKLMEKYEVTSERIVRELAKIGFANMDDYVKIGPDGAPTLDLSRTSRDERAALQEITVEQFKDGRSDQRQVRRIKFKLADKQNALMLLGRDLGMFSEKRDHKHDHRHTLIGVLLDEIDQATRGTALIEHQSCDGADE
jgi:phage terminase small subunit